MGKARSKARGGAGQRRESTAVAEGGRSRRSEAGLGDSSRRKSLAGEQTKGHGKLQVDFPCSCPVHMKAKANAQDKVVCKSAFCVSISTGNMLCKHNHHIFCLHACPQVLVCCWMRRQVCAVPRAHASAPWSTGATSTSCTAGRWAQGGDPTVFPWSVCLAGGRFMARLWS